MNKKGFTLTELLAVIAIVAIIAVIAVPSIIAIRKNMNEKMYKDKVTMIESAAETYANNNPDIFNASTEEYITVGDLVDAGFLEPDDKSTGEVLDPSCEGSDCSMNNINILLTKRVAGVTAKMNGVKCNANDSSCQGGALTLQVCERFNVDENDPEVNKKKRFIGKYGTGDSDYCTCKIANGKVTGLVKKRTNTAVEACLIYGDVEDNYLEYNGIMWRVIGVYKLDGEYVTKIITNDTVDGGNVVR